MVMWRGRTPAPMRKADLVLAILAVAALAATAVGGLSGDRWTDERTLHFSSHEQSLPEQGPTPASGAGARFNWTAPDNATATNLTIALSYSGQAIRGGTATVSVRVTTPDGQGQPPVTQSWTIAQGSTSGQITVNLTAVWAEAPLKLRDTTSEGHSFVWDRPLEVLVTVDRPADLPLAQFTATATASGTVWVFQAAQAA
jgi:hypothetical protein